MREGIAKHGGYEINTEGDAFQVAFTSVHQVGEKTYARVA